MKLDNDYFVGEMTIAQLSQEWVSENFEAQRDKLQTQYLNKMLGKTLAKNFLNGLDVVSPIVPEQKWLDLRDGVEGKWGGFINEGKTSPIANYVYYYYNLDLYSASVGSGEVVPANENSRHVLNYSKLCKIWNEMVEMNLELNLFLRGGNYNYSPCSCSGNELFKIKNSLNV